MHDKLQNCDLSYCIVMFQIKFHLNTLKILFMSQNIRQLEISISYFLFPEVNTLQ